MTILQLDACFEGVNWTSDFRADMSPFDPDRTPGPTSIEADCVSFSTRRTVARC
jgi:hypothetical protein